MTKLVFLHRNYNKAIQQIEANALESTHSTIFCGKKNGQKKIIKVVFSNC